MTMMNLRGSPDIAKRAVDRCLTLAKLSENVGNISGGLIASRGTDAPVSQSDHAATQAWIRDLENLFRSLEAGHHHLESRFMV